MHSYRSNQSALMTRCGTDLRHGIFVSESPTSFTRNAGSEEGRLFSQATEGRARTAQPNSMASRFLLGLRFIYFFLLVWSVTNPKPTRMMSLSANYRPFVSSFLHIPPEEGFVKLAN